MSEKRQPTARKVAEKEVLQPKIEIDIRSDENSLPDTSRSVEENYRKRKAEVTQQDYDEFLEYLKEKSARDEQQNAESEGEQTGRPTSETPERASPKVNRRNFLTVVAGTAAVGEAAVLGYSVVKDQTIPAHGAKHAGDTYTEPQRHNIERELVNPRADIRGRGFGNWVLLMPTKMSGGTYAVDLNTGRASGLGIILELRGFQPDLAPFVRVPERRSGERFRVGQQHPGRQEFPDLRHPNQHRNPG